RLLVAQNAATRALTRSPTVAEAIPLILSAFGESLGWDLGSLWRVDRATRTVRCTDVWHRPGVDAGGLGGRTRRLELSIAVGIPGRTWMTREPAWIPDLTRYPNFRLAQAERHGLRAAFAFPILYLGDVTGVIEFVAREARDPDAETVAMASVLGTQVGEAIE